jgi:hypothetical protein
MTNPGFGFSTSDCGTDSKSHRLKKEKGPAVSAPGFFFPFP